MCGGPAKTMMEHMSTATFTHTGQGARRGATIDSAADQQRHGLGGTLRAIKVFAGAAISVVLLGNYADEK
ncbi:hypothetical protein ADK38_10305 [Streptomyces varsoviensis]|uniref:Uncharacterized protein n=2 Tax=Streptomyces varsoviensis TaxID=67373 RepID=A0ABR5J9U8_9ACTN|nr:hypothetical protein ADK38_10305 [Streptomyces varsoviensis]